ncbi:hypothetical protein VP01_142g8 [Puccinia sorghi]|uniref:Uncharacterized protein n=1 Tax=Puccinia sorghi TaxID=27349 RepID=A0A0L6VKG1_9BASI|nr:hypothetical protein VP01_142g8 [Puccinia sorghi]
MSGNVSTNSTRNTPSKTTKSHKPTGDPSCPVWVCEAKRTNFMIKDRARSLAFVDEEEGDDSTDER